MESVIIRTSENEKESITMGLPKRNIFKETTKELFESMTPEERKQFDEKHDKMWERFERTGILSTNENAEKSNIIEKLKKDPTSVHFDIDMDIKEFLEKVRAGEYDAD